MSCNAANDLKIASVAGREGEAARAGALEAGFAALVVSARGAGEGSIEAAGASLGTALMRPPQPVAAAKAMRAMARVMPC